MFEPRASLPPLLLALLCLVGLPALAQEPEAAPEPPEPNWELKLGLSYVATSGNSDTSSGGFDLEYKKEWEVWSLEAGANALRADEDDETTAERYGAFVRGGRELTERLSLTAGLSLLEDRFTGVDLRTVADLGLKQQWVDTETWTFDTTAALTWTREELVDNPDDPDADTSEDSFGALLKLAATWQMSENASATSKLTYYPNFDESDDYRFDGELGVQAALTSAWALKVAYQVRYDNLPVPGFDTTDTTTTASLVLKLPRG
jgi:putative salt-induced outer membrane protein